MGFVRYNGKTYENVRSVWISELSIILFQEGNMVEISYVNEYDFGNKYITMMYDDESNYPIYIHDFFSRRPCMIYGDVMHLETRVKDGVCTVKGNIENVMKGKVNQLPVKEVNDLVSQWEKQTNNKSVSRQRKILKMSGFFDNVEVNCINDHVNVNIRSARISDAIIMNHSCVKGDVTYLLSTGTVNVVEGRVGVKAKWRK